MKTYCRILMKEDFKRNILNLPPITEALVASLLPIFSLWMQTTWYCKHRQWNYERKWKKWMSRTLIWLRCFWVWFLILLETGEEMDVQSGSLKTYKLAKEAWEDNALSLKAPSPNLNVWRFYQTRPDSDSVLFRRQRLNCSIYIRICSTTSYLQ